ncbi:hypothetical protein ACHHYP_16720 [Achlya hypogyna]|uniref:VLIG-type G domain-containing protein n=1 Tax=Achlya hypogyna TaxID=1202772 RepID=A0A1V9Y600_ACHHY|nr:hypothetical protein ACHHYP_16720 [Achlya hypogyna]
MKLIQELRAALRGDDSDTKDEVVTELNALTAKLGLDQWNIDQPKLQDSSALLERLKTLDAILLQALPQSTDIESSLSDEQVVARASGGAALYGVNLGMSEVHLTQRAPRPILQQPETCSLNGPILGSTVMEMTFTSISAASNFRSSVKSCGNSFAIDIHGSFGFFGASAGYSRGRQSAKGGKSEETTKTTSAAHVRYAFEPVKSFRFAQTSMRLSEEAITAARDVTNEEAADYFLDDFGSHVSCGDYHLGGIFWKTTELETTRAAAAADMVAGATKHASAHLSPEYATLGFGVGINVHPSSFEVHAGVTGTQKETQECEVVHRLECTGPQAPSYAIFQQLLHANNRTWFLIDRPASAQSLVGVWDLLVNENDCARAAELVRDAWLKRAQSHAALPQVHKAMERARVKAWLCDPSLGSELKNTPVTDESTAKHVAKRQATKLFLQATTAPDTVGDSVVDLLLLLLRFDCEFGLDLIVDFLRRPETQSILANLPTTSPRPTMQRIADLFAQVIDDKLMRAKPPVQIDAAFRNALQQSQQLAAHDSGEEIWEPPVVCAAEIPQVIEQLASSYLAAQIPNMHNLTTQLGALLVKNLLVSEPSAKQAALWEIANGYSCHEHGFDSDLTDVHIEHMVTRMRAVFQTSRPVDESSDDEVPPASPFRGPVRTSFRGGRSLRQLLVVAPRPDKTSDLPGLVWFTLKHRLSLVKELYGVGGVAAPVNSVRGGRGHRGVRGRGGRFGRGPAAPTSPTPPVLDALLQLQGSLTPAARAEVHRLLLDRRFLVPFLVSFSATKFQSEATALGLVETFIGNRRVSLMDDSACMRVAVVSKRPTKSSATKDWISGVFHVNSVHCLDRTHGNNVTTAATVAELGWGFLDRHTVHTPVMVLHVVGDYKPLLPFIHQFADALIVDSGGSEDKTATLPGGCVIYWCHGDEDEFEYLDADNLYGISLCCPITVSHNHITDFLLDEVTIDEARSPVGMLVVPRVVLPVESVPLTAADAFQRTDFVSLRSKDFELQQLFVQQASLTIALEREVNGPNRQVLLQKIQSLEVRRASGVRVVRRHPLLRYFMDVLQLQDAGLREIMVIDLERRLAENCDDISRGARDVYRQAREVLNKTETTATRRAYAAALDNWSLVVTGIEHLWRELSHVFASDPNHNGHLPQLAVQHLLDGFPLELMDGDAAMGNMKWIRAVLNRLGDSLPKGARIFVLSIMGVQSAGKSTLLNYMFGVRLRTSVSRCTRGINIQLLEVDGRAEYDYILLLDTEGIRSPEYVGMDGSAWRDNRMATLAILPSDATIILSKGESTVAISEILPIVLSVFLGSDLAEKVGGHLTANLYFAFNQIDLAQSSNMETIVDTLMKNLRDNAKKIQEIHANQVGLDDGPLQHVESSTEYFRDFRADIHDAAASDVRFLGMTQGPSAPPQDAPLPDYGERLLHFRDHVHARGCERGKAYRTVAEFNDALSRVWQCIGTANFQLNFAAVHEQVAYEHLMRLMAQHTQALAKIYSDAFDDVLKAISADDANGVPFVKGSSKYTLLLNDKVVGAVEKLELLVLGELTHDRFAQWKDGLQRKWTDQKRNQASHSVRLVEDKVAHVFLFKAQVSKYKQELQDELSKCIVKGDIDSALKEFDSLFEKKLARVRSDHTPLSHEVHRRVHNIFMEPGIFTSDQLVALHHRKVATAADPQTSLCRGGKYNGQRGGFNLSRSRGITPTALVRVPPTSESSMWTTIASWVPWTSTSKEAQVRDDVNEFVRGELAAVTRYTDDVVIGIMMKTKYSQIINKGLSQHLTTVAIATLYDALTAGLYEIQASWDYANSVVAKFATCKQSMRRFAESICEGHKAADLLAMTLGQWLKDNIPHAFEEEITSEVADLLKNQRWVQSAEAMQAFLDKDLLQRIGDGAIECVLDFIARPFDHSAFVMTNLIKAKVQECHGRVADAVVSTVKESIAVAAAAAGKADANRSECFVHELRLALQLRLKLSGTSALVESLPKAIPQLLNCDEQGPSIFTSVHKLSVPAAVLQSLDQCKEYLRESTVLSASLASSILDLIRDEAFGVANGVAPRCGKPCPMCGCPCTKALGHVGSQDSDDVPHDTYHQPSGLIGISWNVTEKLAEPSCPTSVLKGTLISHTDGTTTPFREFDKAFPGWAVPQPSQPLPLREYIFAKYQMELSQKYNKGKSTNIPQSYFHDLDDLTRQINRLTM